MFHVEKKKIKFGGMTMTTQQRKLFRSNVNHVIAGICGGLGEYMNVDPTIIRLVWILLTFLGGSGLLLYIIMYFVIPRASFEPTSVGMEQPHRNFTPAGVFGMIFIAVGFVILLDNLDLISFHHWWCWGWEFFFPGILILAGIYFLTSRRITAHHTTVPPVEKKDDPAVPPLSAEPPAPEPPFASADKKISEPHILHRSRSDKKILGVCGGLAEYFGLDVTLVRVAYIIFTVMSGGVGFILYVLLYILFPEDESQSGR
jgi:phage shock protein C